MNRVKMIGLDMDGTLLLSDHRTIHPRNIEVIREAQQAGVEVWISSGRLPEDITDFLRRADLDCGMVCLNGAVAYSGPLPDGEKRAEFTFPLETALQVIDRILPYNIMINAFEAGKVLTVARKPEHRYHLLMRGLIDEERGGDALREGAARGIYKFYCMEEPSAANKPSDIIEEIRNRLVDACLDIQVTRSAPGIVEIMPSGVGKGQTLLSVAARMGIEPEAVMTVGDEENDLDMLNRSSFSVAMANSSRSVLETCAYLTTSNDDAGVAEAIRFALGKPSGCVLNPHRVR